MDYIDIYYDTIITPTHFCNQHTIHTIPSTTMPHGPHHTNIRCILIDQRRKVLLDIFMLKVPLNAPHNVILAFLRFATPALRDMSNTRFKLYTPLAYITPGLSNLSEELVDLHAPLPQWHTLNLLVPQRSDEDGVDIIIRVQIDDSDGNDSFIY